MLLTMAWRNLRRNGRRSLVTILAICFGFAAITLFGGYIANVFEGLKRQAIEGETLGHLTVAKKDYFEIGMTNPEDFVFTGEEVTAMTELLAKDPDIALVSPRLSLRGLASNGRTSVIFIGDAIVRTDYGKIRKDFRPERGGMLDTADAYGIVVAENLAKALDLEKGDGIILFASTIDGQANALDFNIVDMYNTGNAATNDKAVIVPFESASRLLDTTGAERLTLMFKDGVDIEAKQEAIAALLQNAGYVVDVRSWEQLSAFYKQVRNLFTMIFSFIFSIVVIIAFMSIVNTMSMVVIERTREIGTLRSIGMHRFAVMRLFSLEGLLLALAGCAFGLLILFGVGGAINLAGMTYVPPNSSTPVLLLVNFPAAIISIALAAIVLCTVLASIAPARRAARASISESLRHV